MSLLFRRLKLPKGASLHSLRHTHTSHLLASGVPLPAVSARLGPWSIRTTQESYSHMIHGQDDEAAKKWEELVPEPADELGATAEGARAVKLCATEWRRGV
jgi:integrase